MTLPLVLDSAGLDALCGEVPSPTVRALLEEAWRLDRDVLTPAVVCAEVCRGAARTRRVEALVSRQGARGRPWQPVQVVVTDFALARQVGAVLHGAQTGSADIVDAHVVAVCADRGGGLVLTSDPADIERLAAVIPSARIMIRPVTT